MFSSRLRISSVRRITAPGDAPSPGAIPRDPGWGFSGLPPAALDLPAPSLLARAGASPRCPPAELGRIDGGQYSVFYRSPGEAPVPLAGAAPDSLAVRQLILESTAAGQSRAALEAYLDEILTREDSLAGSASS